MGIIDSTNPGLVNVANEAYPPLQPDPRQALPVALPALGSAFAAPFPPILTQSLPRPSFTEVESLPAIPPSFATGVSAPTPPTTNVGSQVVGKPASVVNFLVTADGSFQSDNNIGNQQPFTISALVDTDAGLSDETYQIFLGNANLFTLGVNLVGNIASFPTSAPAKAPENVPQRPILAYSTNWILVAALDGNGNKMTNPNTGNKIMTIAVERDGPDVLALTNQPVSNVTVSPTPQSPTTVVAPNAVSLGNIRATDGVVVPFVGSGQAAPPFIGTFEVENQTFGTGLPTSVFVG